MDCTGSIISSISSSMNTSKSMSAKHLQECRLVVQTGMNKSTFSPVNDKLCKLKTPLVQPREP